MLCCFLLTALKFSKFYSVALDGILTRDDKTAIEEILKQSNPHIYWNRGVHQFKITLFFCRRSGIIRLIG